MAQATVFERPARIGLMCLSSCHPPRAEAAATASSSQLIDGIYAAEACNMKPLADACLDSLASRLVTERPWPASVDGQLVAFDQPMLVDVMRRMGPAAVQRALAGQADGAEAAAAGAARQLLVTSRSSMRVYSMSADAGAGACSYELEVSNLERLLASSSVTFDLAGFKWEVQLSCKAIRDYGYPIDTNLGFDLQGAASRTFVCVHASTAC